MERVGRRVLEREYWKSGEKSREVKVPDASEGEEVMDDRRG